MKKWMFLTLLLPLFTYNLNAAAGSRLVYKAKFCLKNGTVFMGSFETGDSDGPGYLDENGSNALCNDEGVFYLLKKKQRDYGSVAVFKNLYYVQPRSLRKQSKSELPTYGFVLWNDLVFVDSNDISKMIFYSAEYSKRDWQTSEILFGTQEMLDTLRNQKYWNKLFFSIKTWEKDPIKFQEFDYIEVFQNGFALYNYNAQINIAELKRLIYLKFPIDLEVVTQRFKRIHGISEEQEWTPYLWQLHQYAIEQKIQVVKAWFWKKGIVMIAVNGGC